MVMGTNDLAKELQVRFRADRLALQVSLGLCLLAAKAEGLVIVDGVYNAFKDDDGGVCGGSPALDGDGAEPCYRVAVHGDGVPADAGVARPSTSGL